MRHALFLGCFIPVRLPHIEAVARRVLPELGVELADVEGFSCCPEPVGFLTDRITALTVAARNISLAEEVGLDIITLCNGCTYTLRQANETLKADPDLRERVNGILAETGHAFRGTVEVRHFAQVLHKQVGIEKIRSAVRKPLTGLRVACHPGCHILSPPDAMGFDDPFDPVVLDEMVAALGAEPVDWDRRTLCCGWTLTNYGDKESANRLLGAKLEAMRAAGADCSAVICPQCFYQFDTGQMLAARDLKLEYKIPTLYYLQLLALAMGHGIDEANIRGHRVKDPALEEKLGRLTA
ncbi:MAG: CoB--CoM heterodisulfide reductase iron-sulfur subunit B family protein [Candidatus Bathyarchaeia archaeon]